VHLYAEDKDHEFGEHIVLACTRKEQNDVRDVICKEILEGKATPVVHVEGRGEEATILFRLHKKYLDYAALAFPMADLSPSLSAKLRKAEEKRLDGMEVPAIWIPGMRRSMRRRLAGYQKIAIQKIIDHEIDMLCDSPGLGKTVDTLAAIKKLDAFPALVVCPNSALDEWAAQIEEHFWGISYAICGGTKMQREQAVWKGADITLVNYEGIRAKPLHKTQSKHSQIVGYNFSTPALFERTFAFAVCDESHRIKSYQAQTTQGFFQLEAERWLYLSATPILNRPEEIWTILHKSYPEKFPSYKKFKENLCVIRKGMGNSEKVVGYKPRELSKLRDFIHSISLRRRKEQVLDQLPDVVTSVHTVAMYPEQRKLYDEIRDELRLRLNDGSIKSIFGVLPQLIRLKQAAFSPELYQGSTKSAKIDELKEIVAALVENGEKVIVFSQWSTATRIIERELKQYNPAYVDGSVPRRKGEAFPRREQANKFMNDKTCQVYCGTLGANREATNLGVASYVIFTDLDWSPMVMDQAVGRSAAGGLRGLNLKKGLKVNVIEIQAEDTVEQGIAELLKRKRNLTGRTIDRDGGKAHVPISLSDIRSLIG